MPAISRRTVPSDSEVQQYISHRVWHMLRKHNVSQTQLANRMGVAQDVMSRRMSGRSRWTVHELLQLSALWEMPVEYFLPELRDRDHRR